MVSAFVATAWTFWIFKTFSLPFQANAAPFHGSKFQTTTKWFVQDVKDIGVRQVNFDSTELSVLS